MSDWRLTLATLPKKAVWPVLWMLLGGILLLALRHGYEDHKLLHDLTKYAHRHEAPKAP